TKGHAVEEIPLQAEQAAVSETSQTLPAGTPLSGPYWLREEGTAGMFRVDDASLIGRPENPPVFPIQYVFEVGGETLVVQDEPVQVSGDATAPQIRRLEVIPPVSLRFTSGVRLFGPGESRPVEVEVTAARVGSIGSLHLDAPVGWAVTRSARPIRLAAAGDHSRFTFNVTAPPQPAAADITAHAEINGVRYDTGRIEIHYSHIPSLLLQPRARLKAVALNLAIRAHEVGYLPGAGDSVAEALEQMGCKVTILSGADLTADRLRHFDAVVVGVRAFNVRTDLVDNLPALFAYVEGGGNVVVQYNRPEGLKTNKLAPFDLTVSKLRVTDEQAPVTLLAPDHPALNTPNKITAADFEGWVQERGVYYPSDWDKQFTPLLASGDPGEEPLKGGLLVAKYGRGYYVYTGLAFFRQLPAGVPGAYRLFANLVSLGK
nr:NEW3 domain-containing protein [Armatimonadota bacterium]